MIKNLKIQICYYISLLQNPLQKDNFDQLTKKEIGK